MESKEALKDEKARFKYCVRCGRKLKSPENRMRGYGPVCWEKSKAEYSMKPLFVMENKYANNTTFVEE